VGTNVSFVKLSVDLTLGHLEESTTVHFAGSKSGDKSGLSQFAASPDVTSH